jgi:hypothetical protein
MKLLISIIILLAAQFSYAQKQKTDTPESAIELIFESLSESNMAKMERAATPDIRILEDGVVWTMDTIRFYLGKQRPADYKRVNSFEFFQKEVSEKMAFVSYHNRADIHANGKDRTVKWLESAVLVREKDGWRVKMLHSTRIK